ncbi:PREDICTED: uncharacterized protein LOC107339095 [Acropora digitifera]|uniref:uncharacterized protein LOC107339095 n=1 Tax=Acropora digitifera TaxID=70779 RepID=UPI00077A31DE|nr:PREDICTED: uncharacterized protein LOC107339095 [Acropora digitifera]
MPSRIVLGAPVLLCRKLIPRQARFKVCQRKGERLCEGKTVLCQVAKGNRGRTMNTARNLFSLITLLLLTFLVCSTTVKAYAGDCQPRLNDVDIKVVGCAKRTVRIQQCKGTCRSEESFNSRACRCCTPVKRTEIPVQLLCKNSVLYIHTHIVQAHEQCTCSRCLLH